jgi:hypothetical protein
MMVASSALSPRLEVAELRVNHLQESRESHPFLIAPLLDLCYLSMYLSDVASLSVPPWHSGSARVMNARVMNMLRKMITVVL